MLLVPSVVIELTYEYTYRQSKREDTIDLAYLAVSVVLFYSCLFDEAHTTHKAEKKGEMKVRLSSHLSYVLRTSHTCC